VTEFQTWIGNREVLAAGSLVVGPKDHSFAIRLGEHWFSMLFVHSEANSIANFDQPNPNALRVTITGRLFPIGAWWDLPNVAVWDGKWIHLILNVRAITEPQIFREVAYTITRSDEML